MKKCFQKMMLLCFVVMLLSGCQEIATQQQMQPTQEKTEAYKLSAFSMPLQQEYVYDYLGMRFSLGKEIDEALEQGSLMMYLDAGYDQTTQELLYARQVILFVPKEDRAKTFHSTEEVKLWRENAQRLGSVGVYKRSVLETTDISVLTNCSENKNIGETPDGTWQYYISSNDISQAQQAVERFRKTLVTIYDMTPFEQGVSIFAQARKMQENIGDFQTVNIYGNAVTKDIFANYDLTLVNVFTTDSSPCIQQIPQLEKVKNEMQQKSVQVIGIVYDAMQQDAIEPQVIEKAKQLHQQLGVTYDFIVPDAVLMQGRLKGSTTFPETFFVDKQGNIIGKYYLGARPKQDWIEIIEQEWNAWKGAAQNE